jgi:hypothetical protein
LRRIMRYGWRSATLTAKFADESGWKRVCRIQFTD